MQTTEWTGHKIDEVIKAFGPPSRTVPGEGGQTMYQWVREHRIPQSSWAGDPTHPTVVTTSQTQTTTWTFWVNQEGNVVSWNRQDGPLS